MKIRRALVAALLASFLSLPWMSVALAHPHVLVDAKVDVLFDAQGDVRGLANTWTFDEPFSAYAIQGYDSKGDGLPTRKDLQPLAQTNVESLGRYHFFTTVLAGTSKIALLEPVDFWDEFVDEKLVLHFTLPLAHPLKLSNAPLSVQVFDPEYFVAVTFPADQPSTFPGEPKACTGALERPEPLDATTAGRLAQIPVTQRELPADLLALTSKLANTIMIRCAP